MRSFHDNDHADHRLRNCFLSYKDKDGKVNTTRIERATKKKITCTNDKVFDMNDPNIEFVYPNLGYYNSRHHCWYVTRSSRRQWRVGLTTQNVVVEPMIEQLAYDLDGFEKVFQFLYIGEYPSFDEAFKSIKDNKRAGTAFSRKFALGLSEKTKEVCIYYKNKCIGYTDGKKAFISDMYNHYFSMFTELTDGKVEIVC